MIFWESFLVCCSISIICVLESVAEDAFVFDTGSEYSSSTQPNRRNKRDYELNSVPSIPDWVASCSPAYFMILVIEKTNCKVAYRRTHVPEKGVKSEGFP